jgi:nucleoside-diphosphate-sugar epimerase
MKVCIVGGTGNISTSITRLLLKEGHQVTCYNRGKSGQVTEGARVLIGDRLQRDSFEKAMQKEKFDAAIERIKRMRQKSAKHEA